MRRVSLIREQIPTALRINAVPFTLIDWVRPVRYNWNHESGVPLTRAECRSANWTRRNWTFSYVQFSSLEFAVLSMFKTNKIQFCSVQFKLLQVGELNLTSFSSVCRPAFGVRSSCKVFSAKFHGHRCQTLHWDRVEPNEIWSVGRRS
jgi:hypothetical protein